MDFSTMYFDSWVIADNTAILHIAGLLAAAIIGIFAIAVNAIRGVPLYKMAQKKGLSLAVLAFFPFTQGFVMGFLADKHKKSKKNVSGIERFVLPVTGLAKWIFYIIFSIKLIGFVDQFGALSKKYPDWIPLKQGLDTLTSFISSFCVFLGLFAIFSLIHHVFFNISLYRVLADRQPITAAVMTALSVMFGAIMGLLMLFVANAPEKAIAPIVKEEKITI